MDLREIGWDGVEWIELIWLRIGTSGGLLWTRYWTFGFHKMLGSSSGAAQSAAPQEGLSSVSKCVFEFIFWSNVFINVFSSVDEHAVVGGDCVDLVPLIILCFCVYHAV
jgi:hypothetical protein